MSDDRILPNDVRDKARKAARAGLVTPDIADAAAEVAYAMGRERALADVRAVAAGHRKMADVRRQEGLPETAYDRQVLADAIDAAVDHVENGGGDGLGG